MANINTHHRGLQLFNRRNFLILGIIILVLLAGFVFHDKQTHHSGLRGEEERAQQFSNQSLKQHDYTEYQLQRTIYANSYIDKQQYDEAERVLNEIIKDVPSDKISSATYNSYWSLYRHKGDVQNRKKYAVLTAQKLKAEGQPEAAAGFEKDAEGK